ncbi:hypothetical protein [Candidatus Phytoplasma melaleucae]|uniref:Effector n=1 Tax=Candidatus Phytoplasma melaleucae TaxID=2982630 RepID=A0ABT9DD79_9MOLU|nr:hypothetical protein ['Melaleuca sp.' phytoplasma]MDO8168042.1 hypothetical protein ['Melaleuca sp.' phytoplasma]
MSSKMTKMKIVNVSLLLLYLLVVRGLFSHYYNNILAMSDNNREVNVSQVNDEADFQQKIIEIDNKLVFYREQLQKFIEQLELARSSEPTKSHGALRALIRNTNQLIGNLVEQRALYLTEMENRTRRI